MLKYVSIISFLIILSVRCSLRGKGWDYTSVWFSSVEFGIPNNCNGDVYSKRIEIYTDSKRPVKIHAISKSSDDLQVFHDSSKVSIDNEFILNSKQPITLDVQIKINPKTICCIFFDLDLYSSTLNFLNQIKFLNHLVKNL